MVRDETLVYFYGGYDDRQDEHVNTVYQLDLEKRVFSVVISNGTLPRPTAYHTAVTYNQKMYVFGGFTYVQGYSTPGIRNNDLHSFDFVTKTWNKVSYTGQNPPPLSGHRAVVVGDNMIVFGGSLDDLQRTNEMWSYNFHTKVWEIVETAGTRPSPRSSHGFLQWGNNFYVFFGWDGENFLEDSYCCNLKTKSWEILDTNAVNLARAYHPVGIVKNFACIFGGFVAGDSFGPRILNSNVYCIVLPRVKPLWELCAEV